MVSNAAVFVSSRNARNVTTAQEACNRLDLQSSSLDIKYFSFIIRAHSRGRGKRGIGLSLTHPSHPPHFRLCKANDRSNNLQLVVSWSSILSPPKNKPFTTCRFPLILTKVLLYTRDVSLAKQIFAISTMSHKPVLFSQVDVIV